jgi:hypothetical protein
MILKLLYSLVSTDRITGPILFEDTVNTERQVQQMHHPFFKQPTSHESHYAFFLQKDYAISHTLRASIDAMRKEFADRIVCSGL